MGYRFFDTCQILADDPGSLPAQGSFKGQFAYVDSTDAVYVWDGATWDLLGPSAGGAPDSADYLVKTANGALSAERVVTDTTTVAWDWATAGQAKANVPDDAITDAKIRESAALSVIGRSANSTGNPADIAGSTVGHVLQVLSGPTVGFGLAPVGNAVYSPDAPPSGSWGDEEFAGGTEALTWRWGNQGSSTMTYVADTAILYTPTSSSSIRARWTTPPSGSFFAAMKQGNFPPAPNHLGGITVLETGSEATPTAISSLAFDAISSGTFSAMLMLTKTSYTSAYGVPANYAADTGTGNSGSPIWLAVSYKSSTKQLRFWWSQNGILWRTDGNFLRTLGAAPVSIGFMVDANTGNPGMAMMVAYYRIWNSEIQTEIETGTVKSAYALIGS